jgi:glyoxylase-like metal-dependent hydrolase (beta-lactamase superfamily II)
MRDTSHIHALRLPFRIPLAPGQAVERFVYAFPVLGEGQIGLVDCGVAGAERVIADYLLAQGRRPEEIGLLALTHAHPDHLGAAAAIKTASRCAVAAHEAERAWVEDVEVQARERPVPGFAQLVGGSAPVDRLLADGDTLQLGGVQATVLHTPGHSRGSLSFWFPAEGALIAGDAIPRPGEMPIYEDVPAAVRSITRLWHLPEIAVLLSSWDEPRRGAAAYQALEEGLQYIVYIHQVVHDIARRHGPLEPLELCRRVAERLGLPPTAANPLTARTFLAHLAIGEGELRV